MKYQKSYTRLAIKNIIDQKYKTLLHLLITILLFTSLLVGISYLSK